jgi:hypothetical protein
MTENSYTLTLNLDSNTLQYITKLLDLFEGTYSYENGMETLENIKCQLNSLKNVECVIPATADMSDCDNVGFGIDEDSRSWR